jgi:predicted phosphodiesterase
MIRLVGDVHGKYEQYKRIIADAPASIQVGDMGVGFRHNQGYRAGEFFENPPHYAMVKHDARFIRGNHDNPGVCRDQSQWIKDGTVEGDTMFIGGALSVDQEYRVENYSWWADEELSTAELYDLTDKYLALRPRVMITHDCPVEVAGAVLTESGRQSWGKLDARTAQAFQSMWSAHSPELWVFGHYHSSFDHVLRGTRFVCLNELEYRDDLI